MDIALMAVMTVTMSICQRWVSFATMPSTFPGDIRVAAVMVAAVMLCEVCALRNQGGTTAAQHHCMNGHALGTMKNHSKKEFRGRRC